MVSKAHKLLPLVAAKQSLIKPPQFVLLKKVSVMKDYTAMVPINQSHPRLML